MSSSISLLNNLTGGVFLFESAMNDMTLTINQIIKVTVEINFYISVILLILGGILSISGMYSIFEFNEDLYGALDNNLRMVMAYLAFSEIFIVAYCVFSKKFQIMIVVGSFLVLMIGSLAFYGEINAVEIDQKFPAFFLYTGVSHILMGVLANAENKKIERQHFNL
jgi:hypothetical protein